MEELKWLEAAMGAVSKINADVDGDELVGARCPECDASDFIKVSDLYAEAVGRIEDNAGAANEIRVGGMTDLKIVAKFRPPRPKSVTGIMVALAILLGALDYFLYRRFGDMVGQASGIATLVVMAIVFLTMLRRYSDQHYYRRRRWNSLFMCRKCGQLVASSPDHSR